jgi:hypothetical protein
VKKISLLFLILPGLSFSQRSSKKNITTTQLDSLFYNLTSKTFAPSDISLPFSSIEILDARFDTTKLGFEMPKKHDKIGYKDFKKIKLEGGINKSIENFYNDYYKLCLKDTDNKLLVVLKTLWIDNLPSPDFKEKRRYDIVKESYQNIYIKFEYYLKNANGYYPIKRVDTVYQLTESILHSPDINLKKNDLSFFTYTLKSLLEKNDFIALIDKADKVRKLSLNSIDSFNRTRFNVPILTTAKLNDGVFLNFNEFKNNTPSTIEYKFKKIKGMEFLYINGETMESHFFWAISDSAGLHFSSSKKNNIIRIGNTFEFFSLDDIYLPKTIVGNILSINISNPNSGYSGGTNHKYLAVPRQVNMETGEIY